MKIVVSTLLSLLFFAGSVFGGIIPPCPEGSMLLIVEINVDIDPGATIDPTNWTLTNLCDNSTLIVRTGADFMVGDMVQEAWCLNPFNQYQFTITDGRGDGLGTEGNYSVVWDGDTIASGGMDARDFGFIDTAVFGDPICVGTSKMVPAPNGAFGDPHIKTWQGKYFDFHGACDLKLMDVPSFDNGKGLEVHIRTKKRYEYSFIETLALRIGDDILEVSSWGEHVLNGVNGIDFPTSMSDMATVTYSKIDDKKHEFVVHLDEEDKIVITTFKDMVGISTDVKSLDKYHDCVGLIGSTIGDLLARDGQTRMKDLNAFGKEWQVRDTERKLFQNTDHFPQYPQECVMPDKKALEEKRRRLGAADAVGEEAAQMACAHFEHDAAIEACVYDVMATNDLEMAMAGAF